MTNLTLVPSPDEQSHPLTEAQVAYLRAVTTQETRRRECAGKGCCGGRIWDSFDGRLERYREDEPPVSKIKGLPPAQERLARLVAWIDQERAESKRLREAKDRFLTALGVPAVRQAEIDQAVAADHSGILDWPQRRAWRAVYGRRLSAPAGRATASQGDGGSGDGTRRFAGHRQRHRVCRQGYRNVGRPPARVSACGNAGSR